MVKALKNKANNFGFANNKVESMMTKHGWSRGQGLGLMERGEAEFNIIVKRKYTKAGLGDVPGSELSNNWWNRLYNTVAKNGTSDLPPEKSTSELLKDEMKKPLQFQKACRLPNGALFIPVKFVKGPTIKSEKVTPPKEEASADESEVVEAKKEVKVEAKKEVKIEKKADKKKIDFKVDLNKMDSMFSACNGLVIHRGSKYGLNSKGKMARLAEQEMKQSILKAEKSVKKEKKPEEVKPEPVCEKKKKKSKKCKKNKALDKKSSEKSKVDESPVAEDKKVVEASDNIDVTSTKKKKKKSTKKSSKDAVIEDVASTENADAPKVVKKKKKSKSKLSPPEETAVVETESKKSKKGKKRKQAGDDEVSSKKKKSSDASVDAPEKKKKKKKKVKTVSE